MVLLTGKWPSSGPARVKSRTYIEDLEPDLTGPIKVFCSSRSFGHISESAEKRQYTHHTRKKEREKKGNHCCAHSHRQRPIMVHGNVRSETKRISSRNSNSIGRRTICTNIASKNTQESESIFSIHAHGKPRDGIKHQPCIRRRQIDNR